MVKYVSPLNDLFSGFDSIVHDFKTGSSSRGTYYFAQDPDGEMTLYVNAPGYKTDDIAVEIQSGYLTIHGEPSIENKAIVGKIVPERIALRFSVDHMYLVAGAVLNDGILTVLFSKTKQAETTKIPVISK